MSSIIEAEVISDLFYMYIYIFRFTPLFGVALFDGIIVINVRPLIYVYNIV